MRYVITVQRLAALLVAVVPVVRSVAVDPQLHLLMRDTLEALPPNSTADDKKWQPAMDFDKDGCYNTAVINAKGEVNPGLPWKNTRPESGCRGEAQLRNNNVYARSRCNHGWCAYMYDYYFEKDVSNSIFFMGGDHRHDWEHIVVFVQDGIARAVAASQNSRYEVREAKDVRWDGQHPKMIYHKKGLSTHCLRFAREKDEAIENHFGRWFYGELVSYNRFPSTELRDKLFGWDFGKAHMAIKDSALKDELDKARGCSVPDIFDTGIDDGSPGQA